MKLRLFLITATFFVQYCHTSSNELDASHPFGEFDVLFDTLFTKETGAANKHHVQPKKISEKKYQQFIGIPQAFNTPFANALSAYATSQQLSQQKKEIENKQKAIIIQKKQNQHNQQIPTPKKKRNTVILQNNGITLEPITTNNQSKTIAPQQSISKNSDQKNIIPVSLHPYILQKVEKQKNLNQLWHNNLNVTDLEQKLGLDENFYFDQQEHDIWNE